MSNSPKLGGDCGVTFELEDAVLLQEVGFDIVSAARSGGCATIGLVAIGVLALVVFAVLFLNRRK